MFIRRMRYELQVAFGLTSLLPLPALVGFALLEWLIWHGDGDTLQTIILRDFALILPLIAGMAVAHLMSVEKDEGFEELRRSYPESLTRQVLWRTGIAFLLVAGALGLGWAAYSLALGRPVPLALILPCLPPTLYLMGLSLLINHLSGSYWAAAGSVMAYWFIEVQATIRGRLSGNLYLFNSVWDQGINSELNVLLLYLVGCLFLIANLLIAMRVAPAWIRSRTANE